MTDDKTVIADAASMSLFHAPKRRRACLVQYSGANLGKRYLLDEDRMILGRSPECQIVISEASVSRQHLIFQQQNNMVDVEDLKSANGTFVNDAQLVTKRKLNDGDILRLGTIVLKFFAHDNIDGIIQDKIYRMATIDAGTQIFNKQYILDTLASEMKFSKAYKHPLSIIYYDLDYFKKVNDQFGHNAGDEVLRVTSGLVKDSLRKDDTIGRYGGEEFVVILPQTKLDTAYELAENMRARMEAHPIPLVIEQNGTKIPIEHYQTVSMGVAQLQENMGRLEDFLEAADQKLYASKQGGRNRVSK